jgi:hypothetical protein
VWASLLPIVAGCSLSAMKEVSFSWGGFNNAMISNLGMVLRNIYSKKQLNDYKVRCGQYIIWYVMKCCSVSIALLLCLHYWGGVATVLTPALGTSNAELRHLAHSPRWLVVLYHCFVLVCSKSTPVLLFCIPSCLVVTPLLTCSIVLQFCTAAMYCLQHIYGINLFGLISIASLLFGLLNCLVVTLQPPADLLCCTAFLYCLQHIYGIKPFRPHLHRLAAVLN